MIDNLKNRKMEKLLVQIEKEIEKASKAFRKATNQIDNLREKRHKDWSDEDCEAFSAANIAFQENDRILTALYPMKEKIQELKSSL